MCFYSDYFRSAFNGGFVKATEKTVHLEDTKVNIFQIFQSWLLIGELSNKNNDVGMSLSLDELVGVWIFGDKFLIPLLKNETIDILIEKMGKQKQMIGDLNFIYEHTAPQSPLRRIHVDMVTYKNVVSAVNNDRIITHWNNESRKDLFLALFARPRNYRVWKLPFSDIDHCEYHDHSSDGEDRETCKSV